MFASVRIKLLWLGKGVFISWLGLGFIGIKMILKYGRVMVSFIRIIWLGWEKVI